ncbi:hypothetical protein BBP40_002019 [Aspergillus hancockii]|nr:hypothetical protein BBP40_002019 [Aspergillus hancockii]
MAITAIYWECYGAAEFDLRSDTITKPTIPMLKAIAQCILSDDFFGEDEMTNSFQRYIAERTQHESALLVLSGTMGNQVAIRAHLKEPPYSVLCDHRAHILQSETGGVSAGATVYGVVPKNGRYLTLEDIQQNAVLGNNIHRCPTKLISLENTLYGLVMPLEKTRRIVDRAHAHNIEVHLGGARLWDAVVSCAAARVAVEAVFGQGPRGEDGKLSEVHAKAQTVAQMWTKRGGRLLYPVETNMVWIDIERAGLHASDLVTIGKKKGLVLSQRRIVIHYRMRVPFSSILLYVC